MASWIADFIDITEGITSPKLFRLWGGIFAVSSALERKVWCYTLKSKLYPNLYVVLAGPPGVGKSEVSWRIRDLVKNLTDHKVASASVTKASLIDELNDATRAVKPPKGLPSVVEFNSLTVIANELGVLIPSYEYEFMNTLTDLYDCKSYEETRRSSRSKPIEIPAPQISLLAACTPSYLHGTIPEGAWDQGFLSRVILIYSDHSIMADLFNEDEGDKKREKELRKHFAKFDDVFGKMDFSEEAKTLLRNWQQTGGEPKPDHPKLRYYTTRRTAQLLKLSIISAVDTHKTAEISRADVTRAIDWMLEAEVYMPEIFKSSNVQGTSSLIEEAWYWIYKMYNKKEKEPVPEKQIILWLSSKAPPATAMQTLELMKRAGVLQEVLIRGAGSGYIPIKKGTDL